MPEATLYRQFIRNASAAYRQRPRTGRIASNEYFLLVVGLVILGHAYGRYLAVKDGIEANLPSRGGKTRALIKEDFSPQSAMIIWGKALTRRREDAKGGDSSMNVE